MGPTNRVCAPRWNLRGQNCAKSPLFKKRLWKTLLHTHKFHIIILFLPSFYVYWFIPCLSVVNMSICVGEKCVHQIFIFALSSINCPPSVELLMLVESLNSNQCLLPKVLLAWQPAGEWNIYTYNDTMMQSDTAVTAGCWVIPVGKSQMKRILNNNWRGTILQTTQYRMFTEWIYGKLSLHLFPRSESMILQNLLEICKN